jgi:putative ABC transport system ATP-binding protein
LERVTHPIVKLKDVELTLTSRAGAVDILRGVSLDIAKGQSVAVVGPSGSGKTSLLMILAGLENATRGSVNVAGHELTALDQDRLAEVRGAEIGIVFQSFHLVPTMTAEENVALPLEFQGDAAAFDKARALLADVGLEKRREHFPAEMSGGEQQRVALARAMATSPKLILADEPTGNLDGNTGRQVVELLFGMHSKTGTTLVLVTHDEKLAARCQRVLRMADGKILSDETAAAA